MVNTHAEYFALCLKTDMDTLPVQLHADSIAVGSVVQINPSTGISSAPADNDEVGLFGVVLVAGDTGDVVPVKIRGICQALIGDTSAVGTPMSPMSDMVLEAQPVIALDGDAENIRPKPAFAIMLETGVDEALKLIKIL